MKQRQILLPAAFTLVNAVGLLAQDSTSTRPALGEFIDGVRSGAGQINSAVSAQSPTSTAAPTSSPASSSTSPSAAPATSSAAAGGGGLSSGAKTGIIVGCVIAAVLIIGLLAGVCCCLMLRKRKRRRAASPVTGDHDHEKPYAAAPANPGRDYSPMSSNNRNHHSMEHHPTAPLLAAGAVPHGRHSQAPSLSQHPAMRPSNDNPFRDSVGGVQQSPTGGPHHSPMGGSHQTSDSSHHGAGAGVAGAAAAGAAGYGLHKHNQNKHQPNANEPIAHHTPNGLVSPNGHNTHHGFADGSSNAATNRPTAYDNSAPHSAMAPSSHHGPGSNLVGPAAAGAAAYGASHHNPLSHHSPTSGHGAVTNALGPASGSGFVDNHNHNQPGAYPALAPATHQQNAHPGGTQSGPTAYSSPYHHDASDHHNAPRPNDAPSSSNAYPSSSRHDGLSVHNDADPSSGLDTLPSSNRPTSGSHQGMAAGAGGAAVAGAAAYGVHQHEEKKRRSASRSRSRSRTRPRSGTLPTRNDADRPPTPFGLSGIGQPYEDMHVHVLQNEAPSSELQRSLNRREETFTGGAPSNRNSRGYSNPPMVPSRSPNRRSSLPIDSSVHSSYSNNETSSNSGGEQYSRVNDPYQPATPHRASAYVPPWEQHTPRYSGATPPTSAGIVPPPVPWDSTDYAQQRRHSHSPRQSMDGSGRRHSRSPATSINGQPRRLRFEDLQPEQVGTNRHSSSPYGGSNQHNSYDGYGQPYDHSAYGEVPYGIGQAQ